MASPIKPEKKHALPPSIANLSLEDSQKLNVDTLKKLKARDKKIAELTAINEKLTAVQRSGPEPSSSAAQNAVTEAPSMDHVRAREEADKPASEAHTRCSLLEAQLRDSQEEKGVLSEQLEALKNAMRQMAEAKDAAVADALAPLREQLQESQAKMAEEQAAWQGETAALQDTVQLQASEIVALSSAKEDAEAGTAKLKGQLEGLQAALQAAQLQSEQDSVELKELQDLTQQAQGSAEHELESLQAALEEAKAEAVKHKCELEEATAQHEEHKESAAGEAQQSREAAEGHISHLEARVKELQAELGAAKERLHSAAAAEQQHSKVMEDMTRLEAALEQLKQEQDSSETAWQQAKEQTAAQNKAADERHRSTEERAAALEETIRQAREEDVAQIAKLEEWQRTATQAAEVEAHLEVANEHIQQLENALTHAQEQAEAAEATRRETLQELAGANTQLRDQAAAAAAANANLDFLRERCARLEAQLAEAQAAEEPHQHHPVDVYLPNQDPENQPAMDVPVEAPGTPVASSARGLDGLSDITVPAKAAMLEARVAELEAQLDALQTEQPSLSFDGAPDAYAEAHLEPGTTSTEANTRQILEDGEKELQRPHAEVAPLSYRCEALSVELRGAREKMESLQLESAHSWSQYETFSSAVAGHLGLESISAGKAAAALAAHEAAHEAKTSELHEAVAAAQRELSNAQTGHADSLAAVESRALQLQEEKCALEEQLQSLEGHNAALSTDLTSYQERHAGLKEQHMQLQAELARMQKKLSEHEALHSQHTDLSTQHDSLQEKHANLMQQHEALKQEHSALHQSSQAAATQNALENLQKEYDALSGELAAKAKALAEHTDVAAGKEQLNKELQQLQAALDTAEKEKASTMQQLEVLQAELEEAQMKHAAAATEASNAKQSLADKELLLVAAAPANGDMGEDAVIKESAARIVSSTEVSPVKSPDLEDDRAAIVKELADVKKRFLAVAKKKQADFAKRVKELEDALQAKDAKIQSLEQQVVDAEAALKAGMAKVSELESKAAAAPEPVNVAAIEARHAGQLAALEAKVATLEEKLAAEEKDREEAVGRLRKEQEAERERVKRVIADLKKKHDRATRDAKKYETALAEQRGRAEAEKEGLLAAAASAEERHAAVQATIARQDQELQNYKARAHALLKAKEAELRTAKEEAQAERAAELAAAQQQLADAFQELDQARQEAQDSLARTRAEADAAVQAAELQALKAQEEAQNAQAAAQSAASTVEHWKSSCEALEERLEAMRAERRTAGGAPLDLLARHAAEVEDLAMQLATLKLLQEELESYRSTAEAVAERKDTELAKALESNAQLRSQLTELSSSVREEQELSSPTSAFARQSTGQEMAPWPPAAHNMTSSFSANLGMMTQRSSYMHGSSTDRAASEAYRLERLGENDIAARPRQSLEGGSSSFAALFGASAQPHPFAGSLARRDSQSSHISSRPDDLGLNLDLPGLQESTLLRLAERQAGREEELLAAKQKVAELEAELGDLQREVELRQEQEQALKEALREVERQRSREKLQDAKGTDVHYLKNVVLKLYETGEAAALLPVVGMMLHFSPAEIKRCQDALARERAAEGVVDAATMSSVDGSSSDTGMLSGWTSWAFGGSAEEPAKRPA